MYSTARIIFVNKIANLCINSRNVEKACEYLKEIHKAELKDRVPIGSYRLKGGFNEQIFNLQ